jgi:hypothetical protein
MRWPEPEAQADPKLRILVDLAGGWRLHPIVPWYAVKVFRRIAGLTRSNAQSRVQRVTDQ